MDGQARRLPGTASQGQMAGPRCGPVRLGPPGRVWRILAARRAGQGGRAADHLRAAAAAERVLQAPAAPDESPRVPQAPHPQGRAPAPAEPRRQNACCRRAGPGRDAYGDAAASAGRGADRAAVAAAGGAHGRGIRPGGGRRLRRDGDLGSEAQQRRGAGRQGVEPARRHAPRHAERQGHGHRSVPGHGDPGPGRSAQAQRVHPPGAGVYALTAEHHRSHLQYRPAGPDDRLPEPGLPDQGDAGVHRHRGRLPGADPAGRSAPDGRAVAAAAELVRHGPRPLRAGADEPGAVSGQRGFRHHPRGNARVAARHAHATPERGRRLAFRLAEAVASALPFLLRFRHVGPRQLAARRVRGPGPIRR